MFGYNLILYIFKYRQYFAKVKEVVLSRNTLKQHVINIDMYCFAYLTRKYPINKPLIGSLEIFKGKQHDHVTM